MELSPSVSLFELLDRPSRSRLKSPFLGSLVSVGITAPPDFSEKVHRTRLRFRFADWNGFKRLLPWSCTICGIGFHLQTANCPAIPTKRWQLASRHAPF